MINTEQKKLKKMKKMLNQTIVHQVLYNPQVSYPPISYIIEDKAVVDRKGGGYRAKYIDKGDFDDYLERLEIQLNYRLNQK